MRIRTTQAHFYTPTTPDAVFGELYSWEVGRVLRGRGAEVVMISVELRSGLPSDRSGLFGTLFGRLQRISERTLFGMAI